MDAYCVRLWRRPDGIDRWDVAVNPREVFRFAVVGLLANKVRSLLTMLGILIGVAAVILLVAVGQGSADAVEDSIESLGSNTITVTGTGAGGGAAVGGPGGPAGGFGGGEEESTSTGTDIASLDLTMDDARALNDARAAPHVKSASPVATAQVDCTVGASSHSVSITGTWPTYFEASNSPVSAGTYFDVEAVNQAQPVAVIGRTVVENLFGDPDEVDPVGESVTCNGVRLSVVGVLAAQGSVGFQDSDDTIIAPISTVQQSLAGYESISSITVQATDSASVEAAQEETSAVLAARHNLAGGQSGNWSTLSSETIVSALTESSDVFTVLLGAVAAISLLVGGIGITNIMLVTVTERTREIGIRKAIGASRGVILAQFLVEATLLSVLGGLVGVVVGVLGSNVEIVGVQPTLVPSSIALAFGVSVLVGLFFGSFPASRAAGLRPIDALRYE
ncbi:ABC transporter permease [Nocardioides renjunii]|uniref:ABC transporter permease n=1 Tax=Nocardioides renjunii TaxID=3095075 RepID=UPI002AFFC9B1|nr:ABC transporter permease [Nocardioides sp. S-34]WQQ20460.1 ABC transporter permease [Nocardioides sp. S-34]